MQNRENYSISKNSEFNVQNPILGTHENFDNLNVSQLSKDNLDATITQVVQWQIQNMKLTAQ